MVARFFTFRMEKIIYMKRAKSDTFSNCYIDLNKNCIIEFTKDGDKVEFPIMDILEEWAEFDNLSISIKQTKIVE